MGRVKLLIVPGADLPVRTMSVGPLVTPAPAVNQDLDPRGLAFNDDGTLFFVAGRATNTVRRYGVSTPYDVSVAPTHQAGQDFAVLAPEALRFRPDGTRMFILTGTDVRFYDLTGAWTPNTGTLSPNTFSVAAQDSAPRGIEFSPNGTMMFVVGDTTDRVYRYNLSTAWEPSTAVLAHSLNVNPLGTTPRDVLFRPDGKRMFYMTSNGLFTYDLTTAFDLATAVQVGSSLLLSSSAYGLTARPDGFRLYHMIDTTSALIRTLTL